MTSTTPITLATVVAPRASNLVGSELDGELTMLSVSNGKYYTLTRVATDLWKMLSEGGPRPVSALCAQLTARYEVDDETCAREVLALLNRMASEGMVTVAA